MHRLAVFQHDHTKILSAGLGYSKQAYNSRVHLSPYTWMEKYGIPKKKAMLMRFGETG